MSQSSFEFRRFMLSISNELIDSDREKLAYCLGNVIPAGKRQALSRRPSTSSLFEELERGGHIGPGNLEFLQKLLKAIARGDLAYEVEKFDSPRIKVRLTPKSVNYVESSGYRLSISGGEHLVNTNGDDYVHLKSGKRYALVINNFNSHRCKCKVKIDGQVIFPGLMIEEDDRLTLDRPCHTTSKFKFFAVKDAPANSGIDERNTEENGVIQVTFTPEVTKMTITCIGDGIFYSVTCPSNTTDVEFHSLISHKFNCDAATILIDGWKPLGKRNAKLEDYDIEDGSRVSVNFGLSGGVNAPRSPVDEDNDEKAPESIQWIPGATTMQGQSEQAFVNVTDFVANIETRKVVLRLRLVARADETPHPSNGRCTPFVLGNSYPPPV